LLEIITAPDTSWRSFDWDEVAKTLLQVRTAHSALIDLPISVRLIADFEQTVLGIMALAAIRAD
jgi:hypothetical protein